MGVYGGTELCAKHSVVAALCPYCEIDRLKLEVLRQKANATVDADDVADGFKVLGNQLAGMTQMYEELYEHHTAAFHCGELADTECLRDRMGKLETALNKIAGLSDTKSAVVTLAKHIAKKALEI